mgnify:CR=1 FL=1
MAEKYIKLENSIPDACAFRNVVKAIDTRQLHTMFIEWMKDAVESISGVVAVDGKQAREKWSNLQGIGVIFSETEENGKKSKQAHYFIYSCKGMTAAQILEAKRSHWGIENKLHWVLDMQFREDESRARADNSAENLNVLRHWAYNLLKAQSSLKGSFSDKQFKCLLDEAFLDKVIASALCS